MRNEVERCGYMKGSVGTSMNGSIEYVRAKKKNYLREIAKSVSILLKDIVRNIT